MSNTLRPHDADANLPRPTQNQGRRGAAHQASNARLRHRPSRSGTRRAADGERIGRRRSRRDGGILRQLVRASVNGGRPDQTNLVLHDLRW